MKNSKQIFGYIDEKKIFTKKKVKTGICILKNKYYQLTSPIK